jgi:hypothetical protein
MECRVYLSAFNYADTEVILSAVHQTPWREKECFSSSLKNKSQDEFCFASAVAHRSHS